MAEKQVYSEDRPRLDAMNAVENTAIGNRKGFIFFCTFGAILVASGLLSLRLDKRIAAEGYVAAEQEVYVFAPARGILAGHAVRIGEEVTAGQPLFSLEGGEFDLRLLEKKERLAETRNRIAGMEMDLRALDIRPGETAIVTAEERLSLLRRIREIQAEIIAAWERLEAERAIRGLEYNYQRVQALRTELEELDSRMLAEWEQKGLLDLERERLERNLESFRDLERVRAGELALLEKQRARLDVTAPIDGVVVDVYRRYSGMLLNEGEAVLKLARMDGRFRVKAYVGQRNVDLLKVGTPVRMKSAVFDSVFEGYVYGHIHRIVGEARRDEGAAVRGEAAAYEVTIRVEETPYPLVLGSGMEVDFLLGRQSLFELLLNRPTEVRKSAGPADSTF